MMLTLMMYSVMYHYLIQGPLTAYEVDDAENCLSLWWKNLLLMHNIGVTLHTTVCIKGVWERIGMSLYKVRRCYVEGSIWNLKGLRKGGEKLFWDKRKNAIFGLYSCVSVLIMDVVSTLCLPNAPCCSLDIVSTCNVSYKLLITVSNIRSTIIILNEIRFQSYWLSTCAKG